MGHAEPGEAISAGPHEPPARERPVAQEPTVVVAWGVAAYDAALPAAAPQPLPLPLVSDPALETSDVWEPRPPALTIPPERELTRAAARQAKLQSRLLTVAALLLFASAGLVVKGALDRPLESTASASTGHAEPPPAIERAPEPVVTTAATAAAPPELLGPVEPSGPAAVPPPAEVAPAPIEELDSLAKPARHPPARRARPIKKPRPEIVRESPF